MNTRSSSRTAQAFTIVELLVATALLALLMIVCVNSVDLVRRSTTNARGKTQQYRDARKAFELITQTISQATLNTYWDYYYSDTASNEAPTDAVKAPTAYIRQSELQFQSGKAARLIGTPATQATNPGHAVFFQAPLGLTLDQSSLGSLLNARGFAIQFSDDISNRPPFLEEYAVAPRFRYRLIEYRPPAEHSTDFLGNPIYSNPTDWFRQDLYKSARVVADNIILLVLSPRVSAEAARVSKKAEYWIAPNYTYNSLDVDNATPQVEKVTVDAAGNTTQGTQHLMPPAITVTMIALDEVSAKRWAESMGNQPVDFLSLSGSAFTDASAYTSDLNAVEDWLTAQKFNFETFSSTVVLRNARWDSRTF
ncbi:MAG: Verru Chthon cassette protein [Prosthecobacter sp.]|nr:Verru Chthon cassette protein [Prosthecobacter sp.]